MFAGAEAWNRAYYISRSVSFPYLGFVLEWLQSSKTGLQCRAYSWRIWWEAFGGAWLYLGIAMQHFTFSKILFVCVFKYLNESNVSTLEFLLRNIYVSYSTLAIEIRTRVRLIISSSFAILTRIIKASYSYFIILLLTQMWSYIICPQPPFPFCFSRRPSTLKIFMQISKMILRLKFLGFTSSFLVPVCW